MSTPIPTPSPEGAAGAGGASPQGQPQSGAPAQAAQPAAEPSSAGDLRSRFNDPEFAWSQYKELQSKSTKDQQRLKSVERLMPIAEALGNQAEGSGSPLEKGFRVVEAELTKWSRISANPKMFELANSFLNSDIVPNVAGAQRDDDDGFGGDLLDGSTIEQHPLVKQLTHTQTQLQTRVNQMESQNAQREVKTNMTEFFASHDLGRRMTSDEQQDFVSELVQTVDLASKNPALRDQLRGSLSSEYIANAAFAWLNKSGKYSEVSARNAQEQLQRKTELGTESPNPGLSNSGGDVGQAEMPAVDALKEYARQEGIDLDNLPV